MPSHETPRSKATIAIIACLLMPEAFADLSLDASIGRKYDDNVSVEELETNTARGDHADLIGIKLGYEVEVAQDLEVYGKLSHSSTSYDSFSQFDIDTNLVSIGLDRKFSKLKAGMALRYADSQLGGDDFIQLKQFSPYASGFVSKQLFTRVAYTYTDKDFDTRNDRDADKNGLTADLYYFLDGVRHYLMAGYRLESENAEVDYFGYDSHEFKVRYIRRFTAFERDLTWRLGGSIEAREYNDTNPEIDAKRDDDRLKIATSLKYELSKNWYVELEYEHSDYESNLPSADYAQDEVSFMVGFKL